MNFVHRKPFGVLFKMTFVMAFFHVGWLISIARVVYLFDLIVD